MSQEPTPMSTYNLNYNPQLLLTYAPTAAEAAIQAARVAIAQAHALCAALNDEQRHRHHLPEIVTLTEVYNSVPTGGSAKAPPGLPPRAMTDAELASIRKSCYRGFAITKSKPESKAKFKSKPQPRPGTDRAIRLTDAEISAILAKINLEP